MLHRYKLNTLEDLYDTRNRLNKDFKSNPNDGRYKKLLRYIELEIGRINRGERDTIIEVIRDNIQGKFKHSLLTTLSGKSFMIVAVPYKGTKYEMILESFNPNTCNIEPIKNTLYKKIACFIYNKLNRLV